MAVARSRPRLFDGGKRSRPMALRALCEPRPDRGDARANASRCRERRRALPGADAHHHQQDGDARLRHAVVDLRADRRHARRLAIAARARGVSRELQSRLFPREGERAPARVPPSRASAPGRVAPQPGEVTAMEWAGLPMLAAVALGLVATGLPAFVVLIGVALFFAVLGLALGDLSLSILPALPLRL